MGTPPGAPSPSVGGRPVVGSQSPVEPRPPLGVATGNLAPFVSPGATAAEPGDQTATGETTAPAGGEGEPQGKGSSHSAASMATEILSVSPNTPVVETTEKAPTTLAEDVTIMAKGRRRRFRLR
jgi:hypothetical protein